MRDAFHSIIPAGRPRPVPGVARARPRGRRGATIIYLYFILLAGLAICTLAVDFGHVQIVKTQLQRCCDVTARGTIQNYLRNGYASAQAAAPGLAAANRIDAGSGISPSLQVNWGYWNSATNTFVAAAGTPVAVQVTAGRTTAAGNPVPLAFPIFTAGRANAVSCDVAASAVAIANTRALFDYSAGFASATPPTLVGSALISGTHLRITPAVGNKAGAAWSTVRVPVGCFTTSFSFQLTSAQADGFCFVLQNASATAMGTVGIDIGYGGITHSLCIKFDLYNNSGEGTDSTGVFTGGTRPTVPAIDMTSTGVVINNGHVFNVVVGYDGTTLTWTITDASNSADTATYSTTVNLPAVIGGSTAYVGFVGSTGGYYAQQDILTWIYSITTPRLVK